MNYCNRSAMPKSCDGYIGHPLSDRVRRSRQLLRFACQYNFVIVNSSVFDEYKKLTMFVLYVCGRNISRLPAPLVSDFFAQSSDDDFTQMMVTAAYPAAAINGTSTAPSNVVYVTTVVYDNTYFIATICLAVLSAIMLMAILAYLGHYCMVGRYEREALVQLLRSVTVRRHYGTIDSPDSPDDYRKSSSGERSALTHS